MKKSYNIPFKKIIENYTRVIQFGELIGCRHLQINIHYKALYERLRANGKSGKLALIAVCNKLLKLNKYLPWLKTILYINQIWFFTQFMLVVYSYFENSDISVCPVW